MRSSDKIMENIENLREKLLRLIQVKEDLVDPEIIRASKMLDTALDEYYSLFAGKYRC